MDTVEMVSDCEFLTNEYFPDSKVHVRIKSILIKLGEEALDLENSVIKEIEISGEKSEKNENTVNLGPLAGVNFAPAEDSTVSFDSGVKYTLILDKKNKIPLKYLPNTVITSISTVTSKVYPVGSTYTTVSWTKDGKTIGLTEVPSLMVEKCEWELIKEEEITINSQVKTVKTWVRIK